MNRITGILICTFLVVGLLAGGAVGQESITVAGSGACQSLLRSLASAYMADNPGIKIDVPDSIGTGGGIKAAGEGKVELGRVARKLKETEQGYGLEYLPFAKVPVVFITNPSVPLKGITSSQSADIFLGKITNWKELGGPDMKIRVIARHAGEASLVVIQTGLSEWSNLSTTEKSKMAATDQETLQFIADIEGAIGFGAYNQAVAAGLSTLSLDGVAPTDPAYPLSIEFGLVYKPESLKGKTKDFVDYLFTPAAAQLMKDNQSIQVPR